MFARALRPSAIALATALVAPSLRAAPLANPETAAPLEPGHLETGLGSKSYYGVNSWLQLGLHPVLLFVLPHLEAKLTWWHQGSSSLSTVHQLAYPSPFLNLIAKEGSLGLLPANSDIPVAVSMSHELRATTRRFWQQSLTAHLGFKKAFVGHSDQFPLLDFPFLYQRFAELHAPWVATGAVALEGQLATPWHYALYTRGWLFTLKEPELGAAVVESSIAIGYQPRPDSRLVLGMKSSLGNYPIGVRMHLLPFLDMRYAF